MRPDEITQRASVERKRMGLHTDSWSSPTSKFGAMKKNQKRSLAGAAREVGGKLHECDILDARGRKGSKEQRVIKCS